MIELEVHEGTRAARVARRLSVSGSARNRFWRDSLRRRILALADALAVATAAGAVLVFGHSAGQAAEVAAFLPVWLVLAKLTGLYDHDRRALRHLTVDEVPNIVTWALAGTAALTVVTSLVGVDGPSGSNRIRIWITVMIGAFAFRALGRALWRKVTPRERTLVLGDGPVGRAVRRKLELFPDIHAVVAGERASWSVEELEADPPWLENVDRIVLAAPAVDSASMARVVALCRRRQIKLSMIPAAYETLGSAARLTHVAELAVIEYGPADVPRSTLALKRVLDLAVVLLLLVLALPLMVVIALALRLSGRPVLFVQQRAGLDGRPFRIYKFRTMVDGADELVAIDRLDEPMFKFEHDPRVTRIGRLLRRWSLDELPQLINVLKGEMSLVGPRPEQVELVERYAPEHRVRLLAKPGITGPMQVFGRGRLTFEERLAVEREYVENPTLRRDVRILALTVAAIFGRRGAY